MSAEGESNKMQIRLDAPAAVIYGDLIRFSPFKLMISSQASYDRNMKYALINDWRDHMD